MIDWKDPRVEHAWEFLQVDPHDLNSIRGELTGVVLEDCSLSFGHETETRASAKIKVVESDYIEDSWIRIVDTIPGTDYKSEIGTFVVSGITGDSVSAGLHSIECELQSVLWTLKEDFCGNHWTIGKGAYALTALESVAKVCEKTFRAKAGALNYRYGSSKAYDLGESYLSIMKDICTVSGNYLSVDGHGRITAEPYIAPASRGVRWELDATSERSVILDDGIERSTTLYDMESRAIVIYSGDNREIVAQADVRPSSRASPQRRGYTRAKVYSISDLQPQTQAAAQALADSYAANNGYTISYTMTTMYFPCSCGEIVMYTDLDGIRRKCMIKNIDSVNLSELTQKLTLKEV